MPADPFAVLQALLRAEASRARRTDRAPEPPAEIPDPAPAPAPEPPTYRDGPIR
ncbi:hypothetical protein AB0M38_10600 [Streptomyces sp. NPDC051742]|uniref:hypothetical protein n=1 Tax=unclassified Streptomyces TaxID=2593676 RepID=UPI00342689EC